MVLFINVLSDGKLQQISYDGECIVGLDCKYQEAEEGIMPENQLWYAYDWQQLIDIVGNNVALDVSRRVTTYWKYTDHMPCRDKVYGIENLVRMIDGMSMVSNTWSENLEASYPFDKSFDDILMDVFSWQQSVLSQEPPMYQRLRKLYERGLIGFESKNSGQMVQNPFVSECLRWNVDPIEYYGFDIIYHLVGRSYND